MLPGNPNFTTEWQHYDAESTIPGEGAGMHAIAFNLNVLPEVNTYYFANIKWEYEMSSTGGTRPQTDEEKHDTLTYAMNLWVGGMMNATAGKVKAWDLVNEAISGGGNIDGFYDLQHATGSSGNDFFWQDYLGNVDYVVVAEQAARRAYALIEGTSPTDLKLFVNDYNLESTWDNNHKLESLIYWIGKWEEAGATIDGIGTQMHISYYLDAESQARQQAAITRMLELMAKTGKLVRISELDMGICDRQFGTALKTEEVTFDQLKAMGEYYKWIIQEYFRIVPPAQQYGICQWCLTDAPASSGWRGGEPVGLWFEDYTRKPAYAGWAEGLQSK
jgi:GH35 family endo-1,4-beta-xylanase